jgi:hypothetical protein
MRRILSFRLHGFLFSFILVLIFPAKLNAIGQPPYVAFERSAGGFTLAEAGKVATIVVDSNDYPGVVRVANDLQMDIERVTGRKAAIANGFGDRASDVIILGTLGRSAIIQRLIANRKLDVSGIRGKWESFFLQVVDHPVRGVSRALVIVGSDKRGAIYGTYDLSEQIGVSPWYWWADVPTTHHENVYVRAGTFSQGEPAVKYRGIFLNDEAPALTGWVKEKFGGYNHEFYCKVFELILRMKGNYLWPAMWNSAFNEDDPLNPKLADEYGIVMGTSHHEPMLRAQQEWKRHGTAAWDYTKSADELRKFWAEGVERNKEYESIITVGMRGDGDMPMSQDANVKLLEQIVSDQREIIADHVNPDVAAVPQDWALYKEVQEYYEKGMRVPDDVTLLWSDDNWGNIRRLPTPEERNRKGGAGIYYHFDYVGGPRNYKWLNTNPISKIWEQMNLAHQYGANRIWIVNVGDLKPMEFPIEFFLTLAWNPDRWPKEKIGEFTKMWAEREFGPEFAPQIADIMAKYTKYNGRRKPELLDPYVYSSTDYREADRVVGEFNAIAEEAAGIYNKLPATHQPAFFELVLYPTRASAQVLEMYVDAAKNQWYATQGRASANDWAERVRALFKQHAALNAYYNHELLGGKWDHMMDQTHLGYTWWQEPPVDRMPNVTEVLPREGMGLGIAPEQFGFDGGFRQLMLPAFDVFQRQSYYIDLFNHGLRPLQFTASTTDPWIHLNMTSGTVEKDTRLWVSIDWSSVPHGSSGGDLLVSGPDGQSVRITVRALNPLEPTSESLQGFVEGDGYVSIEAAHYTSKTDDPIARWEEVPDLGRTLSGMSIFPVTAASISPPNQAPHLDYQMYLFHKGEVEVEAILDPTQNLVPGRGLRYAISWDDQPPQVIDALEHNSLHDWEETVKDSARIVKTKFTLPSPGYHTLKFWMVDPGVVLQKLVVNTGGLKPSYLGPPESFHQISPAK